MEDRARVRNPIDAFILKKLEKRGLSLSPEADPLTLMRRAYFDLTGLPPEPEEVERFLANRAPHTYEELIDRLLASRRYGERWARYWLDLAGYEDWPHAYRYRDYVIRSFNADKPYDRFLQEQIAGDELVDYESVQVVDQGIMDNLVATGFLRMAPDSTGVRLTNFVKDRVQVISDEITILSSSVLSLTVQCARCHDHKFDPISQSDYYRLAATLKGAFDEHDWLPPQFSDDPNRPALVKESGCFLTSRRWPIRCDWTRSGEKERPTTTNFERRSVLSGPFWRKRRNHSRSKLSVGAWPKFLKSCMKTCARCWTPSLQSAASFRNTWQRNLRKASRSTLRNSMRWMQAIGRRRRK